MGLEDPTFISGLTKEWPTAGDPKSQGDNHIRLIKKVLQNTFPAATGPFYPPGVKVFTGTYNPFPADANSTLVFNTGGSEILMSLPAAVDIPAGWYVDIVKYTTDDGYLQVYPPSGTIQTAVGSVNKVMVGCAMAKCRFLWTGGLWLAMKDGPMVGSTLEWCPHPTGSIQIPCGHMLLDTHVYDATKYEELLKAINTNTTPNHAGRVAVGKDVFGVLLQVMGSAATVVGSIAGAEQIALSEANLASHTHTALGMTANLEHTHNFFYNGTTVSSVFAGNTSSIAGGAGAPAAMNALATSILPTNIEHSHTISATGSGTGHNNVQPTVIVNKLIRAC